MRHDTVTGSVDDGQVVSALARRWDEAAESGDTTEMLRVAVALARADRPAAAATVARDALSVAAADPRAYEVAAWLQRRAGDAGAARQTQALIRRYLGLLDDPDALERGVAEAEDRGDVAALLALAERHRRYDRVRSALDVTLEALRLAPRDRDVHMAIVRCHLAMGERALAVEELTRLVRLAELDGDTAALASIAAVVNDLLLPGGMPDPV
jgi:tetratricopeptide (TPR) repeat protein